MKYLLPTSLVTTVVLFSMANSLFVLASLVTLTLSVLSLLEDL